MHCVPSMNQLVFDGSRARGLPRTSFFSVANLLALVLGIRLLLLAAFALQLTSVRCACPVLVRPTLLAHASSPREKMSCANWERPSLRSPFPYGLSIMFTNQQRHTFSLLPDDMFSFVAWQNIKYPRVLLALGPAAGTPELEIIQG